MDTNSLIVERTERHRFNKERLLDDNLPALQLTVKDDSMCSAPATEIGTLDSLPLELLQHILSQLDLHTLEDFRRVNRRAVELVSSLLSYRTITTYARNALRGILVIGTARWITGEILYRKLYTHECERCGEFGGYLYLLTCQRLCFFCLDENKLYLPLRRKHASLKFGLDLKTVKTLPQMTVITGKYSPLARKVNRCVLVDYESAKRAGLALHRSQQVIDAFALDLYNKRLSETPQGSRRGDGDLDRMLDPSDRQEGHPFRYVAVARVPWLSKGSQKVEWGFHCRKCENSDSEAEARRNSKIEFGSDSEANNSQYSPFNWRRLFTTDTFGQHQGEHQKLQNGEYHMR